MLQTHGGPRNNGTDKHHEEPRGRSRTPTTQLQLPKNRSTGNLAVIADNNTGRGRMRFSFDAGSVTEGGDAMPRLVLPLWIRPDGFYRSGKAAESTTSSVHGWAPFWTAKVLVSATKHARLEEWGARRPHGRIAVFKG
ncbi:serine threonine protein [Colletotrichum tofieldiae]|nr:serine threonine protein [Colletotrichum tofieldiae]GKT80872.1 serine threonine protein [Colletotrichum tofieldiae]